MPAIFYETFFATENEKVVLKDLSSSWADVNAGVSQGSILEPLLLLIYINDLSDHLKRKCKPFAEDASFFAWFMMLILQREWS